MSFSERCKICGRPVFLSYHIKNEIWEEVVPEAFKNKFVCLLCFDYFSSAKNISYAPYLSDKFYFIGDKAYITFIIDSYVEHSITEKDRKLKFRKRKTK